MWVFLHAFPTSCSTAQRFNFIFFAIVQTLCHIWTPAHWVIQIFYFILQAIQEFVNKVLVFLSETKHECKQQVRRTMILRQNCINQTEVGGEVGFNGLRSCKIETNTKNNYDFPLMDGANCCVDVSFSSYIKTIALYVFFSSIFPFRGAKKMETGAFTVRYIFEQSVIFLSLCNFISQR